MTGEFTAWCSHYYELTELFSARCERFKNLLNNAPPYTRQSNLSDIDAIISYNRKLEAARAKGEKTYNALTETRRIILLIMRHFEIPPRTVLTGEIPGELHYEIWANENDDLFIGKISSLPPAPVNPNIITIKCWNGDGDDDED